MASRIAASDRSESAAREPGSGRHASTPSEIPARGWKDILFRIYGNIGEDRVMLVAAGVTFYALLVLGAEIDAEMEHQTVRDNTTGRPKPLGQRRAIMADTVGAAH